MDRYIYDESNGLWYELDGDYYIPCINLPEEYEKPIGIWGRRHHDYIKEHKKTLYTKLMLNGTLFTYLADINTQAEEMFSELVKNLAEKEGVTEKLKAENQMEWVGRMNNIRNRATEIVNANLIYT